MNKTFKKLLYKQLFLDFYPMLSEKTLSFFMNNHRDFLLEQAFSVKRRVEFMLRKRTQEFSDNIGYNWFTGNFHTKDIQRQYKLWREIARCKEKLEEIYDIVYHLRRNEMIKPDQLNYLLYVNRFKFEMFYINIDVLSFEF